LLGGGGLGGGGVWVGGGGGGVGPGVPLKDGRVAGEMRLLQLKKRDHTGKKSWTSACSNPSCSCSATKAEVELKRQ